ncbi:MAG: multicopper oxidase domain-containing protein [Pseudomonadota bacterium]
MRIHPLSILLGVAVTLMPFPASAVTDLPATVKVDQGEVEPVCNVDVPSWRNAQVVEGVEIRESRRCSPDDPATVAAFVKGTNNISMETLMDTVLSADTVIKKDDVDGDGDPDRIIINLEVVELNGHSPDFSGYVPTFDIAPGIQPGMWVFAPKTRGMATKSFVSVQANDMLRAPSPVIRVEQGDTVWINLENTHYLPHTIHLHGVDHPFVDGAGNGNDGVPQTSELTVMPGESRTYEIKPRHAGTMVYHCHVQTHVHLAMGLVGMFVVEKNRPNNWLQTLNVGAGHVRHPSVAVLEKYDEEYDLHYHGLDKELHNIIQKYNDPRLIGKQLNNFYDLTDSTEDYHTLNGLSFPYTLRESLITVEPNQNIKLRMFNSQGEMSAVHTHGHKATITHYDGVEHNPVAQITRDIFDLAPAQRVDLWLNTTDDGLHSYGEGVWVFHDHVEKGITTDGMNPGGGISAVVYKSYLTEEGLPKVQGVDITQYFTKKFQSRNLPVWQDADEWNSLGDVPTGEVVSEAVVGGTAEAPTESGGLRNFLVGLLLGVVAYLVFVYRKRIESLASQVVSLVKASSGESKNA